jgi:DNA-binding MarR family transcriptional regulator
MVFVLKKRKLQLIEEVRMSEHMISEEMDKILLFSVRKIIRAMDQHSRRLIKTYGLTIPQLLVLQEVMVSDRCTVSGLARAVALSQPTVTDIVERLLKRGFLTRFPSGADKRSNIITITDEGTNLLNKKPSLFPSSFFDSFSSLQEWEKTLILSTLQKMAAMISDVTASSTLRI